MVNDRVDVHNLFLVSYLQSATIALVRLSCDLESPLIVFNLLTTVQAWFIVISIAKTQSFEGGIHCFWAEEKVL